MGLKNENRGRRFHNEKKARRFAEMIGVEVIDLRGNKNRRSDFKVNYTKSDVKKVSIETWDNI